MYDFYLLDVSPLRVLKYIAFREWFLIKFNWWSKIND